MNAKKLHTLSDEQLAIELQRGNKNAMSELYARYHMLVFNKCLSFSKNTDDASDLTQDVMIRVMEKIGSFRGESKFSTWLYAVTFNFCTDHVRKARRKYIESIDTISEFGLPGVKEENEDKNQIEEEVAERALAEVSAEDLQLLLMKYQFNKSILELQETYSLSASAVKMRLLRARSKAVFAYESMKPAA